MVSSCISVETVLMMSIEGSPRDAMVLERSFSNLAKSITFLVYDDIFFNTSCMLKTGASWLIWINITSDEPVKAVIGSKVFEGRNITYGCINMRNVSITASQDTIVVIEVRSLTPCIFSTRYADLHRIFQAMPNLYADRECP